MKNLIELGSDNSSNILEQNGLVLLDFHASWCGPCKSLNPIIRELASDNEDTVTIGKIDVDSHGELARTYGVRGIPTVIFLKNGKEVDKVVGLKSKAEFQDKINTYLN